MLAQQQSITYHMQSHINLILVFHATKWQ